MTRVLPPELIDIIREYEMYNKSLKLHGRKSWPALKQLLMEDPERIRPALLAYEKAQREWSIIYHIENDLYHEFYRGDVWDLQLEEELEIKRTTLHTTHDTLLDILRQIVFRIIFCIKRIDYLRTM